VQVGLLPYACTKAAVGYLDKALLKELKGTPVQVCSIRPGINVTEHLLHGSEHLDPARWEKTKKVFNILGDRPETTTPWLADKILATRRTGTRIVWLSTAKIAWRFTVAPFRKRDLFADL
jgi:short-subunit dehydrogenase